MSNLAHPSQSLHQSIKVAGRAEVAEVDAGGAPSDRSNAR
jgi:hypothetical protein